jgi:hypothetical protein
MMMLSRMFGGGASGGTQAQQAPTQSYGNFTSSGG